MFCCLAAPVDRVGPRSLDSAAGWDNPPDEAAASCWHFTATGGCDRRRWLAVTGRGGAYCLSVSREHIPIRPPESQKCQRCASAFIQEQCTSSRDCPTLFRPSTSRGFPVFFISRLTPAACRFLPICSGAFYPFLCCQRVRRK